MQAPTCSHQRSPWSRRAQIGCGLATRSDRPRPRVTNTSCSPSAASSATSPFRICTRRHIDDLIVKLRAGSLERPGGRARKAWSARSCNYMLGALSQVLAQLVAEGRLARNVAGLVDRVPGKARKFETFTADQVRTVLGGIAKDRNRHAWHLALAAYDAVKSRACVGMTSISRQRTVRIGKTRVDVGRSRPRPRRPEDGLSRTGPAHT